MSVLGTDGSGNRSTWESSSSLSIGVNGVGTLLIGSGGLVSASSGNLGIAVGGGGTATISGSDSSGLRSTWQMDGFLAIGVSRQGDLKIRSGAFVSTAGALIARLNGSSGAVAVRDSGSERINSGGLWLGGDFAQAGGTGTLDIADEGIVDVAGPITIWDSGTLTIDGGTLTRTDAAGVELNIEGGVANLLDGGVNANMVSLSNGGQFNFTGGTLSVVTFSGDLTNAGGKLAPGASAGSTAIVGDYAQQAGATLEIEVGGSVPISEHDLVSITGNAVLGGSLELSLIDTFIPDSSDTFTVLGANSIVGFFAKVSPGQRLDTVDGIGSFQVNYGFSSTSGSNLLVLSDFIFQGYPGDFNLDLDVDGADFLLWQRNPTVGNLADWQSNYGNMAPAQATSTAVPEPSAHLLLTLGLAVTAFKHRPASIKRHAVELTPLVPSVWPRPTCRWCA